MIYLGLDDLRKSALARDYCANHEIRKVYVLSPARFAPSFAPEHMTDPTAQGDGRSGLYIDWPDIILYRYFYKLMQEIDRHTLVVVNECLRTQNRHSLTYNCIRNFLNQTEHRLIFQYLPLIDTAEDFMVLFDFDTRSQWKREPFRPELMKEARVACEGVPLSIQPIHVTVDAKTQAAYAREKAALLEEVRSDPEKDPHMIPRNLLLVSGKAKLRAVDSKRRYVGRNNRFKLPNVETYKDVTGEGDRVVFELPHSFLDFTDYLAVTRQRTVEVLVADTKTEAWYLTRYQEWAERVRHAQAVLCQ